MQSEVERLGSLVDDLLTLARADADTLSLDVRPVAADAVVEQVYQAMAPLAERERQVTLARQIPDEASSLVYADSARLTQALMNLTRNAITHTPTGGLVSIVLASGADPDSMLITVSDTGAGISEVDLPHIFERFYRADVARARDTGGFGLGLSIVRDMVEAMGGTVSARNGADGGAQFQITLRVVPADER
jgi:two-component system sensor histidine kinase BaeS